MLHQQKQKLLRSIKPQHYSSSTLTCSSSFPDTLNISNEVLSLINNTNNNNLAVALKNLIPFLNRQIIVSVLHSQSQFKHTEEDPRTICFRFFIWAAAQEPRLRSGLVHILIVDMLTSSGDDSFDLYWSVLDEWWRDVKLPVSADASVVLMLCYWRLRRAEKAVEAFGRMRDYGCKPNLAAYNVILHVLVKKDVILLALAVYNMMLKSNAEMGCDTFSVLIDGLCKNGMTEDALRLFDEMTDRGILPSRITYTVIMSGLCRARRTGDAHRLFDLMKSRGCSPGSVTYNALLDGFCKFGGIDEAFVLFKSLRDEGYIIGLQGFSCVIDGLIRAGRAGDAEELFHKVSDVGLAPDLVYIL